METETTTQGDFTIRQATLDDVTEIAELLRDNK